MVEPSISAVGILYYASVSILIVVLLFYGIKKESTYYLHAVKWLMIVDVVANASESIIFLLYGTVGFLCTHIAAFLLPIYAILIVHSYEAQLFENQFFQKASYSKRS